MTWKSLLYFCYRWGWKWTLYLMGLLWLARNNVYKSACIDYWFIQITLWCNQAHIDNMSGLSHVALHQPRSSRLPRYLLCIIAELAKTSVVFLFPPPNLTISRGLTRRWSRRVITGELKGSFRVIMQVNVTTRQALWLETECSFSNVSEGCHLLLKVILPSRPLLTLQVADKRHSDGFCLIIDFIFPADIFS